mgnify:CR=1 FL=1
MSDRKVVYAVRERKEGRSFWCRVGSCFTNRDGSFSIVLDALPIDGRLVVREEQPREDRDDLSPRRQLRAAVSPPDDSRKRAGDLSKEIDDDIPF